MGNHDLPTEIRVVVLTPIGKAAKVAESRFFKGDPDKGCQEIKISHPERKL